MESLLSFHLDANANQPLYEQIYAAIKNFILDGTLERGAKLPSTRALSSALNVSRNTVDTAYCQLAAEGFIDSSPRSGFYVSDVTSGENGAFYARTAHSEKTGPKTQPDEDEDADEIEYDFSPYAVDISKFPYSTWKKLSRQSLNDESGLFLLGHPFGDMKLREEICSYVLLSRGVECVPEQIVVGAGADYLLQMLSLVFRHMGIDEITMENPCYMRAAKIFQNNFIKVGAGALDEKGLVVSSISNGSRIVYVTPSHEYPLGIVMPYGRRMELLNWAYSAPDRYIIEDDHDSEFRYKGKPIPALCGMDARSKVIYAGTFSKAVAPAIRAAYIILPPRLLKIYSGICGDCPCTVSRLDQSILAGFLSNGYFEKHVNRMRKIYKAKHDAAVACLEPYIDAGKINVLGDNAGLHLVMILNGGPDENELLARARSAKIKLYGLSEHYLNKPKNAPTAFLIGYSNLTIEQIKDGLDALLNIIDEYAILRK